MAPSKEGIGFQTEQAGAPAPRMTGHDDAIGVDGLAGEKTRIPGGPPDEGHGGSLAGGEPLQLPLAVRLRAFALVEQQIQAVHRRHHEPVGGPVLEQGGKTEVGWRAANAQRHGAVLKHDQRKATIRGFARRGAGRKVDAQGPGHGSTVRVPSRKDPIPDAHAVRSHGRQERGARRPRLVGRHDRQLEPEARSGGRAAEEPGVHGFGRRSSDGALWIEAEAVRQPGGHLRQGDALDDGSVGHPHPAGRKPERGSFGGEIGRSSGSRSTGHDQQKRPERSHGLHTPRTTVPLAKCIFIWCRKSRSRQQRSPPGSWRNAT